MRRKLWLLVAVLLLACRPGLAQEKPALSPAAEALARNLDAMEVEKRWLAGETIDWRTGEANGKTGGPSTHCSAFVAAACVKLGAPMLTPPPQTFLAGKQQDWLLKEGKDRGWREVSAAEAQQAANEGQVVVASWKNPDPKKPGHIVIVRPSAKDAAALAAEGPDVCQAGRTNYNRTSVKEGFKNHPDAWAKGEILYFAWKPSEK